MLKKFKTYIKENHLCKKKDKILIATSGGVDSVVLLDLFVKAGYQVVIAHCNFNLRNQESDNDEQFVKTLAEKYRVKLHVKSFDTIKFAKDEKLSIEMAARNLRYHFFYELLNEFSYDYIATGHHLNDAIETVFLNLTRGSGLKGLTGIKNKNGKIIRPLLFATRGNIEKYALNQNLSYRNDSSNESDKYMRNIIRKYAIPAFKKINPTFEKTMEKNIRNLDQSYQIYCDNVERIKNQIVKYKPHKTKINIERFLRYNQQETLLFEIVKDYGFNGDQIPKIIDAIHTAPGKMFYTKTHQLLVDREFIKVEALEKDTDVYTANSIEELNKLPIKIKAALLNRENFVLQKDSNIAHVDADLINFPINIRKWNNGDSFYPLGMSKKKKLSDFFIDEKVDRFKKEKTWLFESDQQIFWVGKLRIDNRFKINEKTQTILKISFI